MNPHVAALKGIVAQLCQRMAVSMRVPLVEFGLEDVLEEAEKRKVSATELSVMVLWRCCCKDGKFNNFSLGFMAVMQLLNERLDRAGEQAFKDLGQMLKDGTTEEAIHQWMRTHFPTYHPPRSVERIDSPKDVSDPGK